MYNTGVPEQSVVIRVADTSPFEQRNIVVCKSLLVPRVVLSPTKGGIAVVRVYPLRAPCTDLYKSQQVEMGHCLDANIDNRCLQNAPISQQLCGF